MKGSSGDVPPAALDPLDRHRFPAEEWRLVEKSYHGDDMGVTETLFAVGNGYLGLRGNQPDVTHFAEHGTYINGFHETWPIQHAEDAYGFAEVGQRPVRGWQRGMVRATWGRRP